MPEIYQPEEDSYFLSEILKKEISKLKSKNIKFLEIGIGSGIQLKTAFESGLKKENIYGVDINPKAVNHCKKLGFIALESDLFSKISNNAKFDIIACNPPYLPEIKYDKEKDTSSGRLGSETINKLLKQAKTHLKEKGKILLLTSSFTKGIEWQEKTYLKKQLAEKPLFFEKLYVWELKTT